MWIDMYLKAESEENFREKLPVSWLGENSEILQVGEGYALDAVGTLEGVAGWHVNLRLAEGAFLPESLAAFVIPTPAHPKRVFA